MAKMRATNAWWLISGIGFGIFVAVLAVLAVLASKTERPNQQKSIVAVPTKETRLETRVVRTVNERTRGELPPMKQVGLLTSERGDGVDEPIMLPLMGRPTYAGSQKWEYYAGSDKVHPMRLPVERSGMKCDDRTGCDEVYDGDTVYVPTYKKNFTATIYEKNELRYIPYV